MKLKFIYNSQPKPMQSVRIARCGKFVRTYQPKENIDWKSWLKIQTQMQLIEGFRVLDCAIAITRLHFIFKPLKSMPKYKIRYIEDGGIIYKKTNPDMVDNLKKGMMDALTDIIWRDDALIVAEDNIRKYYGLEPRIELEIETIEETIIKN